MERFLAGVRSEAPSAEYNRAAGIVTLRSWDDWILLEPVTFAITPENLDQACVVDAQTRDALWPGDDITTAGLRLMLVHLDRLMRTERTTGLAVTPHGWWSEEDQAAFAANMRREQEEQAPVRRRGRYVAYNPTNGDTYAPPGRGRGGGRRR